jgi:hypothetical protein
MNDAVRGTGMVPFLLENGAPRGLTGWSSLADHLCGDLCPRGEVQLGLSLVLAGITGISSLIWPY